MLSKLLTALVFIALVASPLFAIDGEHVLITEVRTGGEEFVEIANNGSSPMGAGWKVQYRSASGSSWSTKYELSADVDPGYIEAFLISGLADSGGHLRLIDHDQTVIDVVSWGASLSNVSEPLALPSLGSTESLKRFIDEQDKFIDTDNNSADFFISQVPSPSSTDQHSNQDYPPIEISEILPDPDLATSFKDEFIELYNPNAGEVDLTGYYLSVGGAKYVLLGLELPANSYFALPKSYNPADLTQPYSSLNLTAGSGEVKLTTPNAKSTTSLIYANGKKGSSYGVDNNGYQWSEKPTPGLPNELVVTEPNQPGGAGGNGLKPCRPDQFRNPATNRCKLKNPTASTLKPCRSDQFRNPETNRCKLKTSAANALKPCASNQTRNPETNRCRLISTAGVSLKPCAANQFRNPATNRCKLKDSANSLKPCNSNQERNPETNRCRLIRSSAGAGTSPTGDEQAVLSSTDAQKNWPLVGVIAGGAVMYALYEFRYDIRNSFQKARGYLGFRSSSGRDP